MKKQTSLDQLSLALNTENVAGVFGISRANAYNLMRSEAFTTLKIKKD